jgi:hypothetical protein
MIRSRQSLLFPEQFLSPSPVADQTSTTFVSNMALPVHRWFRYSAGFSAEWVESEIRAHRQIGTFRVFDPFAGSATTLLAAEAMNVESCGIEAHPFISRVAQAKLEWRSSPDAFKSKTAELITGARSIRPSTDGYPDLIYKCYDQSTLEKLDVLRQSYELVKDESPASNLAWLALIAILRKTSKAGTAQWQYVLPKKQKRSPQDPFVAFEETARVMLRDLELGQTEVGPRARLLLSDARTCEGIPNGFANLVICSPPYPNNYDYADATSALSSLK